MDEYVFQSRAARISFCAFGAIFSLLCLVDLLLAISCAWSMCATLENTPESREFLAQLAKQAKQDAQAAETLRKHQEVEGEIASARRALRYFLCAACLPILAGMVLGIVMVGMPTAAARRRRRRAVAWETRRCGFPHYRVPLSVLILTAAWLTLYVPAMMVVFLASTSLNLEDRIGMQVCLLMGALLLFATVVYVWWRFHCRDWRIRLAEVPVRPGESVQFEVFRESGKPIDKDLRMEVVGWQPKWNIKKDCFKSSWSLLPRTIRGEVHLDVAPGPAPRSISGNLRFEGANLAAVPPDGVKYPRRLIPFLRLRKGWWRRCLFDLPAPALYVRPEAERQSSVDERPNGH